GGGGTGVITPVGKTQTFTKITPGAVAIVKNFDAETGVKEIEISVSNEAQNVKITVTKYDSKPAVVSVSKTGKVYQYLQINAQNLDNKLEKAKTTFKVEKTWASTNGVAKENVVVSKFDEASSQWNELATTYSSEDDTYYYYTTELSSFSYFAISEKAVEAEEDEGIGAVFGEEGKGIPVWVWVVVGLIILAIVVGGGAAYKKRK
ncbi:MAG TPA: PGF-pre-PGF domain-containing protein, partial [Candidatus Nanoarchaeia archaeon]|nr:PGF-pre-PGF domain-containing protein [Candidatus Nanoarchaeia archaeon]